MSPLNIPFVNLVELNLQQHLSRYRHTFTISECKVTFGIALPPNELELALSVCWRGIPLRLFCNRAPLARWLEPHLQGADFRTLPSPLQLALLDQEGKILPGLIFNSLASHSEKMKVACLSITLSRGDERLILWLEGNPKSLLRHLPGRPLSELAAIKLRLSLQLESVLVNQTELRTLNTGDVFLIPSENKAPPSLQGYVEGRAWAHFHQHDTQLELIRMHNDDLAESTNNLSNLDQLLVQVSFEVGRKTLDLHTLATLEPGSLIDLATPLPGEVRILANQSCIAIGELVNIQERLGIRVQRMLVDTPS